MNVYDGLVRYVLVVVLLCSTLFYFVLLCSTLFYFVLPQLYYSSRVVVGFMVALSRSISNYLLQNLFLLAVNCSQFVQSGRLLLYVCIILLHNTYIHTYIPPLGGVCMYVCMYIVKNYILYNMYLCIYYNSVEFEKLMLKLSLKLSLK